MTAQNNLGYCYEGGIGVPINYAEAVKWYKLSAEQGCAKGQNNIDGAIRMVFVFR